MKLKSSIIIYRKIICKSCWAVAFWCVFVWWFLVHHFHGISFLLSFLCVSNMVRINNWVMKWLFAPNSNGRQVCNQKFYFWCVNTHESLNHRINERDEQTIKKTYCNVNRRGKPFNLCVSVYRCNANKYASFHWIYLQSSNQWFDTIFHNIDLFWSNSFFFSLNRTDTYTDAYTQIHYIVYNLWIIVVKFEQNIDFKAQKRRAGDRAL